MCGRTKKPRQVIDHWLWARPHQRRASLMLLNLSQIVVFLLNDKCVFITTDSHHRLSQFSYFWPVGVLEQIDWCFDSAAHRASVHIFRWNQGMTSSCLSEYKAFLTILKLCTSLFYFIACKIIDILIKPLSMLWHLSYIFTHSAT